MFELTIAERYWCGTSFRLSPATLMTKATDAGPRSALAGDGKGG